MNCNNNDPIEPKNLLATLEALKEWLTQLAHSQKKTVRELLDENRALKEAQLERLFLTPLIMTLIELLDGMDIDISKGGLGALTELRQADREALLSFLQGRQVTRFVPELKSAFDPSGLMHCSLTQPTPNHALDGLISKVTRPGYLEADGSKVYRPAHVVVFKKAKVNLPIPCLQKKKVTNANRI